MQMKHSSHIGFARPVSLFTTAAILVPTVLAGCSGGANQSASIPPSAMGTTNRKPGMSTKQKVVLLAGAAALYYVYRKYQNNKAPSGVQYYKSEANGRIYYRDPKTKQAIYVTPPARAIEVPADQAREYQGYAGYNNQPQGQQFGGFGYNANNKYQGQPGSVPAPTM